MQKTLGDSVAEEIIFGPERRYREYLDAITLCILDASSIDEVLDEPQNGSSP